MTARASKYLTFLISFVLLFAVAKWAMTGGSVSQTAGIEPTITRTPSYSRGSGVLIGSGSPEDHGNAQKLVATTKVTEKLRAQVEPSIVYLQFWAKDKQRDTPAIFAGTSTGFIVQRNPGEKRIITAAHSLATTDAGYPVNCVKYRSQGQMSWSMCKDAIIDEPHDIAVLTPSSPKDLAGNPLNFHVDNKSLTDSLYALGSASGLEVQLLPAIYTPAQLVQLRNWARSNAKDPNSYRLTPGSAPLDADLLMVQHGVPVAPGFSGCPIFTADGRVMGIQSSVLQDAPHFGLAIHHKHFHQFNWEAKPRSLGVFETQMQGAEQLNKQSVRPPPERPIGTSSIAKTVAPSRATIKIGGLDVEAPFIHQGYVTDDAFAIVQKYVQHKEWFFEEEFSGLRLLRLHQFLKRSRFALIKNPVLGLQLLVLEGYGITTQQIANPDGLVLSISPPGSRHVNPPYDVPLTVKVTVEPELFIKARSQARNYMDSGKVELTPEEKSSAPAYAKVLDSYTRAHLADIVEPRFVYNELKLRLKDTDKAGKVSYSGARSGEAFVQTMKGSGSSWLRSIFTAESKSSDLGHIVRIGSRDPLVVVVHIPFSKSANNKFMDENIESDVTDTDYLLIGASVSTEK